MSLMREDWDHIDLSDVLIGEKIQVAYHPGRFLKEELLDPYSITEYRLSKEIGVHPKRIYDIVNEKRSITIDTALRLEKYFGISKEMWMGLQNSYDFDVNERENPHKYDSIRMNLEVRKKLETV